MRSDLQITTSINRSINIDSISSSMFHDTLVSLTSQKFNLLSIYQNVSFIVNLTQNFLFVRTPYFSTPHPSSMSSESLDILIFSVPYKLDPSIILYGSVVYTVLTLAPDPIGHLYSDFFIQSRLCISRNLRFDFPVTKRTKRWSYGNDHLLSFWYGKNPPPSLLTYPPHTPYKPRHFDKTH